MQNIMLPASMSTFLPFSVPFSYHPLLPLPPLTSSFILLALTSSACHIIFYSSSVICFRVSAVFQNKGQRQTLCSLTETLTSLIRPQRYNLTMCLYPCTYLNDVYSFLLLINVYNVSKDFFKKMKHFLFQYSLI